MTIPHRRALLAAPLVLAVLALAGPAAAQGTSEMLPDPISHRDLDRFAERLDLTTEQRNALDELHRQYREDFRVLRETDIEAYMEETGGLMRRGFGALQRDVIVEAINDLERVMGKITLTDDRFFDSVQAILTEEQIPSLPAAMQARERQRYSSGGSRFLGFVNQAARVDLGRLYATLELAEQEREAADPFVARYEGRLSPAVKDMWETSSRMFLTVVEYLEDQGVELGGDPMAMDEQQRRRMFGSMRDAWNVALEKPREKAVAISDLNRVSLREISAVLAGEHSVTLRDRYLRRAYTEVPRTATSGAERSFRALLRRDDLPTEMHGDVENAAAQFRQQRTAIVEEMLDYIDGFRSEFTTDSFRGETRDQHRDKIAAFRERLEAHDEQTIEALYALLDADRIAIVEAAVAAARAEAEELEADDGRGRRGGDEEEDPIVAFANGRGPDPFLPGPIHRRDLRRIRDRLGLGESDWYILESLHEDYLDEFDEIRQGEITALRGVEARLRNRDDDAEAIAPELVDQAYEMRKTALESIRATDGVFFEDLAMLVADPKQEAVINRLRLARDRDIYSRGLDQASLGNLFNWNRGRGGRGRGGRRGGGRWGGDWMADAQSHEPEIDLGRIVDDIELSADQRGKADEMLAEYEAAAADGFRQQYESVLRMRRATDKFRAQREAERREGGDGNRDGWRRWRESFDKLRENQGKKLEEARQTMVDLNRGALETLTDAMPSDVAETLRDRYNREAYPGVYDNPEHAERYLSEAFALQDLVDSQRSRLDAIWQEYAPRHRELADRTAAIYDEMAASLNQGFDRGNWQQLQQRANQIEVIEFDRREIEDRAMRQLRDVLTERQQTRLRMPDAEQVQDDEQASF